MASKAKPLRIVVLNGDSAEAEAGVKALTRAGHRVVPLAAESQVALRPLTDDPPDAVIVDLSLRPSHGLAIAVWLRGRKATRHVPLVFIEGEAAKTAKARSVLPDAAYGTWRAIRSTLRRALAAPPETPLAPGAMAGYSGTPLPKKLGLKAGSVVALLGAPADFERTLGELPEGVTLTQRVSAKTDVALLFVTSRAALVKRFATTTRALPERVRLWMVWPKKASGTTTDLTQQAIRDHGLAAGWVDFKICAVDETWSGLCFVRRRA